ncbi:XrtA/PEP-CTERM system TPR-repeat protein PrsT [Aliiglaciecola litoralis]|uniref:PEP-CTERM system TPR-repeat lipoprotein n=1 Tax=Aliiglaciecola litoralis TaxID=582857 RepID=A0ABP3WPC1_9ALTE
MRTLLLVLGLTLIIGCSQKTSEDHLKAAQDYIAEKRLDSAVLELKNAIKLDPRDPVARFELGKVYLTKKQYESAEKELNRALEYGQPASDVIPLLSQAYQNTGALSELSEIDHTEAGMSPEQEIEVGFFKLQSFAQLGKEKEAKALVEQLSSIKVDTVYRGLVDVYGSVMMGGDVQQAVSDAEALVAKFPNNADLLKFQGQLYLRISEPEKAAEVYKSYLQVFPEDTQTVFVLAKLLVDNGKILEAEPYIDQLLAKNAENPLLNQLKSVVSAAKNEHEDAQRYAEKAIQNGRGDPVLRLIAGHSAYILKDFEAANRHLSYIASSLPPEHPGLKMLAASQLELGMSGEASEMLSKFDNVSEDDAKLFSKTGYELIRSGNIKEAKEVVERSAAISRTAEDLTRLGVLRLSLNDVSGIIDLETALEKSPEMEVTRATLANAYLATNQLDKAKDLATDWIKNEPQDFKGHMLLGEVYVKQGDFAKALDEFNKADAIEPENGLVLLAIANLDLVQQKFAEGAKKLKAILDKKADFVPAIATYYLALRAQEKGKEGMQPALDALKSNPNDPQIRLVVARMYLSERNWQDALNTLEEFDENDKTAPAYWNIKGKSLLGLGVISDANQHYDKWIAAYPNSKDANLGKLLLLDAKGDFKEGAERSAAFLEVRDDLAVRMLNVHFLVMSGQINQAKVAFAALPDNAKQLPVAQGFQARILLSENDNEGALEYSKTVYENIPNSRNAVLLAVNLERLNRKNDAMALLQAHAEQFPQDVAVKMMLAERQITSDESKAIATYEKTLKLNPNNFVVLNNLAYLYIQEGRLKEAETYARQAVDLRPDNADAVDTLAQALMKQQKYDEALKFYDRVVNDKMKNNEIFLNYVEVLFAKGNNSLARRKLSERKFEGAALTQRVNELKAKYGV